MRRIYHLKTCSTCQRILKELEADSSVELIDIKQQNIDADTLKMLRDKVGSYEHLFSRKAMKYRSMGLHEKELSEEDYKNYMLEEYTFLKRPFMILDGEIFIGNSKKTVEEAKAFWNKIK
ncbi:MAG: hypothetical protein EP338_05555 [Bacteroidetes bacterium]|nr:MAG: hypothetical protein EP338_05555 [Bacteroidota bacterium]